jgi:hypothetical protein
MSTYQDVHRQSITDRETFWRAEAALVDWHSPFQSVLDYSRPPFAKWFVGGRLNLCHNAIDRHLAARGGETALLYISTETGENRRYTYRELAAEVNRFAAILKAQGVGRGDRVLIYMPMIAEAAFAMLACVRIGAIHSVVFGGFAAASLATRIDDAAPKVMVTSDAWNARRQADSVQASRGRGAAPRGQAAAQGPHRESRARSGDDHGRRPGPRLRVAARQHDGRQRAVRMARIVRAFVHPLHVRHDRQTEGRAALTPAAMPSHWRRRCAHLLA